MSPSALSIRTVAAARPSLCRALASSSKATQATTAAPSASSSSSSSAPPTRPQVLSLYRSLLRSARVFATHNYRDYVHRRTRDAFRSAKTVADPAAVSDLYAKGLAELAVARRQGWINAQFKTDLSVVERA
ncbi:hypothetical protein BDZ88DRAFT_411891 [Geranomyces variabilis]|nr:hypothetical protein BDZ88DRAFT_411891 [Geranomyces variabilis]KAJ3133840.1 hypothetical protein HDU90_005448 [Geranomyces variabilis]